MDIGKNPRRITIEPVEQPVPVPDRENPTKPEPVETPEKETVGV